jgi:hypothetical protein
MAEFVQPDFLGSQKSSLMAAHVRENQNLKSSLNISLVHTTK